jgi:hypothetical protein
MNDDCVCARMSKRKHKPFRVTLACVTRPAIGLGRPSGDGVWMRDMRRIIVVGAPVRHYITNGGGEWPEAAADT